TADGRVINTDYAFPAPTLYLTQRSVIAVARQDGGNLYISDVSPGPRTRTPLFAVARDLPGTGIPSGGGKINIASDPHDLAVYYDKLAGMPGVHITLFRADGVILARNPTIPPAAKFVPDSDVMHAISADPAAGFVSGRSSLDGRSRYLSYKKLDDYP